MGDVTTLNRVRKVRAKLAAQGQAAANRVKFGRDKAAKAVEAKTEAQTERRLNGAKRES